jgi:hypothetical protein
MGTGVRLECKGASLGRHEDHRAQDQIDRSALRNRV